MGDKIGYERTVTGPVAEVTVIPTFLVCRWCSQHSHESVGDRAGDAFFVEYFCDHPGALVADGYPA